MGHDMEVNFMNVDMPISWLAMPEWKEPAFLGEPGPDVPRGRIEDKEIGSEILDKSPTVQVYLPAGYDNSDRRYRTLYIHGGDSALKRAGMPASLDNLFAAGQEPLIVVFVKFPGSIRSLEVYAKLWSGEIVKSVDANYRTIAESAARANWGTSFAASVALYCTILYPEISMSAAAQSPELFSFISVPLDKAIANAPARKPTIHIESGVYDLFNPHEGWDVRTDSKNLADSLSQKAYPVQLIDVPHGSGWSSWKNRTDAILRAVFPAN
jgi:enterochelin esterase-like enzyme